MRRAGRATLAALALAGALLLAPAVPGPTARAAGGPDERFRQATEEIRAGDAPRAIALLGELASGGRESASLYWNWAQAASSRGAHGEALWALLRAREVEPGDRTLGREIERLREAANLDPAEVAPEPLAAVARLSRRLHLGLLSLLLAALSLAAHAVARARPGPRWPAPLAWAAFAVAVVVGAAPVAGSFARPTAVVVARGAELLDAASGGARALGKLREGEVVVVLSETAGHLRVEDSSGARGWAPSTDVRRLDRPPSPAP